MSALFQLPGHLVQPYPPAEFRPVDELIAIGVPSSQPPRKQPRSIRLLHGDLEWEKFNRANDDPVLKALNEIYVIDDREAVAAFIEKHGLRGLLLEAKNILSDTFGDAVKVLTIIRDEEGFDALFCYIRTEKQMEAARQALAIFDASWWLTRYEQAKGNLNFDFELV